MKQDRRKHPRFKFGKKVEFVIYNTNEGEAHLAKGIIQDVSKSGFFIASLDENIGDQIHMVLDQKDGSRKEFYCKVVRKTKKGFAVKIIKDLKKGSVIYI